MQDTRQGLFEEKYFAVIFDHPYALFLALGVILIAALYFAQDFHLDVSAESLVLEDDVDLEYYRTIAAQYGSDEYLIVVYDPINDLFLPQTLSDLKALQSALSGVERVESVVSILNVPLLESPPISISQLSKTNHTLSSENVDLKLAQQELTTSTLYRERLVSADGSLTALQVIFKRDQEYWDLLNRRDELRRQSKVGKHDAEIQQALEAANHTFHSYNQIYLQGQTATLENIREILSKHGGSAKTYIGGVPMIAVDMMAYIQHDIKLFGLAVFVVLGLMLALTLRKTRWVFLPFAVASAAIIFAIGFLGYIGWPVTVVSSNFISLVLIFSISLIVHLIVFYQELYRTHPDATQRELITRTLRGKTAPCFFTIITTMIAFSSLVLSGIRPVIDFGWMMAVSLAATFVFSFTVFPAALALMAKKSDSSSKSYTQIVTGGCATLALSMPKRISLITLFIVIFFAIGIKDLSVENRFIDYFRQSTDIYQGMALIDAKLGGTTPLDIVIDRPPKLERPEEERGTSVSDPLDDMFDELMEDDGEGGITTHSYWFNTRKFSDIALIHNYLDDLSDTGKVLSLHTAMTALESLDDDRVIDDFFLSLVYERLPDALRVQLIDPYFSESDDQIRFSIRVRESDPTLNRQHLIENIRADLGNFPSLTDSQVSISGMLVLYNNLLQSLFRSQILTLGAVFIAIALAFAVLFRSLRLAAIAIVPNILAAVLVLGTMGWLGIPLDIMTITIAAISVGIAVDDTIHYIHRYREECANGYSSEQAVRRSHASIGRAMYYTSSIITIGFLILTLSNFIPTVYFGLLTGLAMLTALLCDLILLPALLVVFDPYVGKLAKHS